MEPRVFDEGYAAYWDAHSRCKYSELLIRAYAWRPLRGRVLAWAKKLEGGQFFSQTLREILLRYHGVEVGRYSYGGCLVPGYLPRGTKVGNYSSVSSFMRVYRRNHPTDRLSQHPFFYNREMGLLKQDSIDSVQDNPLTIGHDVWIGHQTVITPRCRVIGDGSIVGAGSVVTRDVEPFTIVGGNPAKVIRRRFPEAVEAAVRESQWWLRPISELVLHGTALVMPVTPEAVREIAGAASLETAVAAGPGGFRGAVAVEVLADEEPKGFGRLWSEPDVIARSRDREE